MLHWWTPRGEQSPVPFLVPFHFLGTLKFESGDCRARCRWHGLRIELVCLRIKQWHASEICQRLFSQTCGFFLRLPPVIIPNLQRAERMDCDAYLCKNSHISTPLWWTKCQPFLITMEVTRATWLSWINLDIDMVTIDSFPRLLINGRHLPAWGRRLAEQKNRSIDLDKTYPSMDYPTLLYDYLDNHKSTISDFDDR